ncbi:MAG: transcription antitermination factor NusB [Bacteroidetes bacterium]|nr:MAG: transcription antitermination factor NusB [Bacteroidota bacterium]
MLNRRHLRVKVLQSLYAFFQSGNTSLDAGEKELLFGIDKIYDLYLYQLTLIMDIGRQARKNIEDNKNKKRPTADDLNPNTRFIENQCLNGILSSKALENKLKERKISWASAPEISRKIFLHFRESKHYQEYLKSDLNSFENDRSLILILLKNYICESELLHHFYEDTSIYWLDDWELVNKMIIKNIKAMSNGNENDFQPMNLYKDLDDKRFARELFKKTILHDKDFSPMIAAKTQNWDIERIALMDIIIMKMALTEITKFPEIPVKVSLNEYIELSKMYSTPKSKVFVNGVLDKLVEELNGENKIKKKLQS